MFTWKSIESAPKDHPILLAKIVGHPEHETVIRWITIGEWSYKYEKWWDGIEPCGLVPPSHWMEIPRKLAKADGATSDELP